MNYSVILFAIVICCAKQTLSNPVNPNPEVIAFNELKSILSSGYEKEISPGLEENRTTEVKITLYILDYEFDAEKKELKTDMYFRQGWTDQRLKLSTPDAYVVGGKPLVERVWLPDTFFTTSSSVNIVKYPSPNVFIRVLSDGQILYSIRLQQTSRCAKKEEAFECDIQFESYGFQAKDVLYKLKKGQESVVVGDLPEDPDRKYNLVNQTAEENIMALSFGEYSRITIKLVFDNQPKKTMVEEVTTEEPVNPNPNLNLMVKEGKKMGKLFSKIQFPSFGN